ncbi:type III restriction endonuclease subunit R, partial [Cyanobacteria bacterium FACHB-471]|nr:type III restriction endonuclease subunit R [Cyanobacteria bacterium FACHB-471]
MAKNLKLKFDPDQDYQLKAIQSVVQLFEGLPKYERSLLTREDEIVSNLPPDEILSESWLEENLLAVQRQNDLTPQLDPLWCDDGLVLEGAGNDFWRSPSFTIEMETGTG